MIIEITQNTFYQNMQMEKSQNDSQITDISLSRYYTQQKHLKQNNLLQKLMM